jgi:meckelin
VNALDIFSSLMFWYLFLMTGYWFVFFKLQERVYCFLPAHEGLENFQQNYRPYDILFGLVCSSKFVQVIFKIYFKQTQYDIYLLDWERPKAFKMPTRDGMQQAEKLDVSAWRWLFLCNELNELQNFKIISTNFTLILYAALMDGFGFVWWTNYSPSLDRVQNDSPQNYPLFFFVTTLLIYLIGSA